MKPRPMIQCVVCEEFHEVEDLRWFNLDRMNVQDSDGKWIRLPHETAADDPNGVPYCDRCAARQTIP